MRIPLFVLATLLVATPVYSQMILAATVSARSASATIDMLSEAQRQNLMNAAPRLGAPYSGREVFRPGEQNAGANQESLTYRDSQGRTRTERAGVISAQVPQFKLISIQDPVGGYEYFLDSVNRVAHRMALPAGRPAAVAAAAPRPVPAAGSRTEAGITTTTEVLAPRMLAGIITEGTRTTTVYGPESQTGRDHPVTTLRELWVAPSLGVIVSSRTTTVSGVERRTTLEDLKTTEPDPALFLPPPDYRIEDETSPFTIQIPR